MTYCIDFSPSLIEIWEIIRGIFNSSFFSAFISALAGAGFGVLGAQNLAERTTRTRELLESLRKANAIIVLAATIANQALTLKKQHVNPLYGRYMKDRKDVSDAYEKFQKGQLWVQPRFEAELTKSAPLTLPIDALTNLIFSTQLIPGRALALVSMLEQSTNDLAHAIKSRAEMIDNFYKSTHDDSAFTLDYFGLKKKDGSVNSMYHDLIVAISQYTDDIVFFGAELAEELHNHAQKVRVKLLKLRSDVPKVSSVDFSGPSNSGLMPLRENYSSWLSGIKSQS